MKPLQLAVDLIKEKTVNGVCTLSKKKLGEILHHNYPTIFSNAEHARATIRQVTGSSGEKLRKKIKNQVKYEFKLPKPEKNDYRKFIVHGKRIGILSDVHLPYYDEQALQAAIAYLKKWKPDTIILNGDIIDCYQLSDYDKDPRNRGFKYEVDMLREFIKQLIKIFKCKIVFKLGNHCERYEKLILRRVPMFVDLEQFSIESVLGLKDYGVEIVDNKRIIKAGKVNILHGHEFRRGITAPVNPARGLFLNAKVNTIAGDCHRTSEHIEQDLNGNIIGCWTMGHLSDPTPKYAPLNRWNHGFMTLEIDGGEFHIDNLKIINGKVV